MRIVWLIVIGLITYFIGVAIFFPAAPVIDRIRPQLGPVALEGVNGKLYKGVIDTVRSTDDLLPLEFSNVGWTLAPQTLLTAGVGASFRFDGYGGQGKGLVSRKFNGDVTIRDFEFNAMAKQLEPLLPVPIASFSGELIGDITDITLANQLLTRFDGTLQWNNALLERPVRTSLGNVQVQIEPNGENSHLLTLNAAGGDLAMDGTVSVTLSGDFNADILFTPSANAPADVLNGLRQIARPDAQGRVRFVRQGNLNR
ncbi:type II secretion system protein N, partial [bacterium]|nr:type II secretion system protein N [bacterium]